MAGMPFPMADKTTMKRTVPKTGVDAKTTTKIANGSATSPRMPDRDGPAKDAPAGKMAGKPKTSAPAKGKKGPFSAKALKSAKASLKAIM